MIKIAPLTLLIITFAITAGEPDASTLYQQGLDAIRAGDNVAAAKLLSQAVELAEKDGDESRAVEINGAIFYLHKKFTLQEATALKSDEKIVKRIEASEKKIEPNEADKWLARVEKFASHHKDDPLRVAIAAFELADKLPDSDAGKKAMRISLDALSKVNSTQKTALPDKEKPVATATAAAPKPLPVQAPPGMTTYESAHRGLAASVNSENEFVFDLKPHRLAVVKFLVGGSWGGGGRESDMGGTLVMTGPNGRESKIWKWTGNEKIPILRDGDTTYRDSTNDKKAKEFQVDISGNLSGSGKYSFDFQYSRGTHALVIYKVTIQAK